MAEWAPTPPQPGPQLPPDHHHHPANAVAQDAATDTDTSSSADTTETFHSTATTDTFPSSASTDRFLSSAVPSDKNAIETYKPLPPPPAAAGTYVVQVAKDQIYRVPPPENAYLAERYLKEKNKGKGKSPCFACLKGTLIAVLVLALLLGLAALISFLVLRSSAPTFTVGSLTIKEPSSPKGSGPRPEYDFKMKVTNPSAKMGYSYQPGGKAVLLYDDMEIAVGKAPQFHQGSGNTSKLALVLHGSRIKLPKAIQKSLNGSKEIISLELTVAYEASLVVGGMEVMTSSVKVACDLRAGGLVKQVRVTSQKCKTQFQL